MRTSTHLDYIERIQRVLRFIQENLDEELSPVRCAQVAHFSSYHFHRVFSGLVGESLSLHVRRLRLERAAGELRRTDSTVLEVALSAGYDAHEPFTRAFRSHFGKPPSVFRQSPESFSFPRALCAVHYGSDDAVSRFVPLEMESNMIEVKVEHQPARRLFALPYQGDYLKIGAAFEQLAERAAQDGLLGPESDSVGVYYDDPESTPVDELRAHAGIVVPVDAPLPTGLEALELKSGDYAIGVHRGPYEALGNSYRWLFGKWLPQSGREPANQPCHEVYVTDPKTTPPTELITHIFIPLA